MHCDKCNKQTQEWAHVIADFILCKDCLYSLYLKALGTREIPLSAREIANKQRLEAVKP